MTSSSNIAHDGRNKFREAVPHTRISPATFSLSALRATAGSTTPAVQLVPSIQSRPLQANPAAPLLWNSSTTQGNAVMQHRIQSNVSSLTSSVLSSMEGFQGNRCSSDGGSDRRGSTTAHLLQPHRPEHGLASPHMRAPQGEGATTASSRTWNTKVDRTRKVAAANYNALLQKAQSGQQPSPSPSPSPVPMSPDADTNRPGTPTQRASETLYPSTAKKDGGDDRSDETGGGPAGRTAAQHTNPYLSTSDDVGVTLSSSSLGVLEGPLPPDVRRIISQCCAADPAVLETAEQQARRLISTGRRVKVCREELAAADEERRDLISTVEQRRLVRSVLQSEVDDINARIQALLQERAICEAQLRDEDEAAAREQRKLTEAEERVTLLRSTIDNIVEETVVPRLMLQQLVPSLLLENYI